MFFRGLRGSHEFQTHPELGHLNGGAVYPKIIHKITLPLLNKSLNHCIFNGTYCIRSCPSWDKSNPNPLLHMLHWHILSWQNLVMANIACVTANMVSKEDKNLLAQKDFQWQKYAFSKCAQKWCSLRKYIYRGGQDQKGKVTPF